MTYIALYRAWRPKNFNDVVGQVHVSKTLKNALKSDRVAHAYLFTGPRGTGKTSSAKILAKAVNCINLVDGDPCDQCANCIAINNGHFFDVFEIDAASNRGIDEIRDIRDKVKFAPSQGKCKVYIIDEVHMLTSEAFNALLKTLEEPPRHVLFILATTEPQKIPLTILSRCQRFDFRKISDLEVKKHLQEIAQQGQINITDSAISTIARKAAGGMRDAISILDQCIAFAGNDINDTHVEMVLGILSEEQVFSISGGIFNKDISTVIIKLNEFIQSGKDIKQIARDLVEYVRQLLIYKISNNEEILTISKGLVTEVKEQARNQTVEYLSIIVNKLTEIEKEMRFSSQPQILLEAGLISLAITETTPLATAKTKVTQTRKEEPTKTTQPKANYNSVTGTKIDLEQLKRLWPEILEAVKQEKITTQAFLIPAIPRAINDGFLELTFKTAYNFHRTKISEPMNRELVEDVIAKITGVSLKLLCTSENQDDNISKNGENSPAVQKALELFGGDIVEIKD